GRDVGVDLLGVLTADAVERVPGDVGADGDRLPLEPGLAVVGDAVLALVEVVELEAGAIRELDGQRGGDPQTVLTGDVTARHRGQLPGHVGAHLHAVVHHVVHVDLGTARGRGAGREDHRGEVGRLGRLGHQVDGATGRAAAEEHRGGTEEDLHRLHVEGVAGVPTVVAVT